MRDRYKFALIGYVVMPEHIHILISEPKIGTPGTVMQVLKQRVSKKLRGRRRKRVSASQMRLWQESPGGRHRSFWQRRFYDFNVWTTKKRNEKLHYMHFNPVKRKLVEDPNLWHWSSYRFYRYGETGVCTPNPPSW